MLELAVFDLDGTLLKTIEDMTDACNHVLELYGYPKRTEAEIQQMVGYGVKNLVTKAIPADVTLSEEEIQQFFNTYQTYYNQHQINKTKPYDGVQEVLDFLIKKEVTIAVLSNKIQSNTVEIVKHFFPYIDSAFVFGQRENVPIKPDPTALLEIISLTHADKDSTVYIGDSEADISVALNAGVTPIGVTWGYREKATLLSIGGKLFADNAHQLIDILKRFFEKENPKL